MLNAFFLAFAYLRYHRITTASLVLAISLIIAAPAATRLVLSEAEKSLGARAASTPLVIGARGSSLDLALSALYFQGSVATPVTQAAVDEVWDSGLGIAIPIHTGFAASSRPVVGTTLDYFDFRSLRTVQGRLFARIGEAVVGSEVAAGLNLSVGDSLVTDTSNLFDLAGAYPLEMTVSGILEPGGTPDDGAIFVDMKTVWIIAGIGHGHEDPGKSALASGIADPAQRIYQSITPENVDSFHFHQNSASLPVSAVLVSPHDARSSTILQGRYIEADNPLHAVDPATLIDRLLSTLFRIGRLLDLAIMVVGSAAAVAIALAVGLATQLRRQEMQTFFRLGAHRGAIVQTVLAQFALIFLAGAGLAATFLALISWFLRDVSFAAVAMTG